MSDNGLRLQVDTQEINADDAGKVMMLKNKIGWFIFSEQAPKIEDIDLPEIKLDKGQKTKSQQLRGVLYRVWERKGKSGTADEFYDKYMARLIQKLKDDELS
jgi:hypothetical protein